MDDRHLPAIAQLLVERQRLTQTTSSLYRINPGPVAQPRHALQSCGSLGLMATKLLPAFQRGPVGSGGLLPGVETVSLSTRIERIPCRPLSVVTIAEVTRQLLHWQRAAGTRAERF